MSQATRNQDNNSEAQVLYMALELSNKEWNVAFSVGDSRPPRRVTTPARDCGELLAHIGKAKERFGLNADARVVSCYEAGRDGFWLHRFLLGQGVDNRVVDSSSIEVNRRARRAKTDRLDVGKLLKLLLREQGGEPKVWSIIRVPTEQQEDERRVHREIERLKKERTAHSNRIRSLLVAQGLVVEVDRSFLSFLENARRVGGSSLGPHLKEELRREYIRWELVDTQVRALEKVQYTETTSGSAVGRGKAIEQARELILFRGVGPAISWSLAHEFFWRDFNNRREVGGASGLTGTPYSSGDGERDQGISKAGNRRVRHVMVEAAWLWVRWQPDSGITQWFERRFAHGGKRMRRVGIVGVARRLLIAFWRYLKDGVVPEGAQFKSSGVKA